MERHLHELELYGFTLVRNALPQPLLGTVQAAFDAAVRQRQGTHQATQFSDDGERTARGGVDFARAYEEGMAPRRLAPRQLAPRRQNWRLDDRTGASTTEWRLDDCII